MSARTRRRWLVASVIASAIILTSCTSGDAGPTDESLATGDAMQLDVLVYNIEYSGDSSTDTVIKDIDADIVGVLESYNRLPEIAEKTGYPYFNVGLQLLSKYPIHEPSEADGLYALIEVQPGYAVAFFNTHLDYVKYGPKLLLDGMPMDEVLASEDEVRTDSIRIQTPDMQSLVTAGYPVFLTGDFNQPSSLDYGEDTVGTASEAVPWTVSEALFDVDMRDTFREIHPDPIENPGITKDNPDFRAGGSGDRIDYVYAGGPVTTVDSKLVGESAGPDVELPYKHWTSDHRAVLSTFELSPVALPITASVDRRLLDEGEDLTVLHNAPESTNTDIIVAAEGDADEVPFVSASGGSAGNVTLSTTDLTPAGYDVIMLDDSGNELGPKLLLDPLDGIRRLDRDCRSHLPGR